MDAAWLGQFNNQPRVKDEDTTHSFIPWHSAWDELIRLYSLACWPRGCWLTQCFLSVNNVAQCSISDRSLCLHTWNNVVEEDPQNHFKRLEGCFWSCFWLVMQESWPLFVFPTRPSAPLKDKFQLLQFCRKTTNVRTRFENNDCVRNPEDRKATTSGDQNMVSLRALRTEI